MRAAATAVLVFGFMSVAEASTASAQSSLCGECSLRLLELRTRFFITLEYPEIYQDGRTVDADKYEATFAISPAAVAHFHKYQTLTILGAIQIAVGGVALIVGAVMLLLDYGNYGHGRNVGIPLTLGGTLVFLSGKTFIDWGRSNLLDAVNAHNRALLGSRN